MTFKVLGMTAVVAMIAGCGTAATPAGSEAQAIGIVGYDVHRGDTLVIGLLGKDGAELGRIEVLNVDVVKQLGEETLSANTQVQFRDGKTQAIQRGVLTLAADRAKPTNLALSKPSTGASVWVTALTDRALEPTLVARGFKFTVRSAEVAYDGYDCHFQVNPGSPYNNGAVCNGSHVSCCENPNMWCYEVNWNGSTEDEYVQYSCYDSTSCNYNAQVYRTCDTACIGTPSPCPGYGIRGCTVTGLWDDYAMVCLGG